VNRSIPCVLAVYQARWSATRPAGHRWPSLSACYSRRPAPSVRPSMPRIYRPHRAWPARPGCMHSITGRCVVHVRSIRTGPLLLLLCAAGALAGSVVWFNGNPWRCYQNYRRHSHGKAGVMIDTGPPCLSYSQSWDVQRDLKFFFLWGWDRLDCDGELRLLAADSVCISGFSASGAFPIPFIGFCLWNPLGTCIPRPSVPTVPP